MTMQAQATTDRLLTSGELAAYLGVSVSWVYEHADRLRVRKLGKGPKARMRFSLPDVEARLIEDSLVPLEDGRS